MDWNERTKILLEPDQYSLLGKSHVLIAGLGGVGGMAAELLCRSGIGTMTIVDCDSVSESNRNRQLVALNSTTGNRKTAVLASRLKDISPQLNLNVVDDYMVDDKIADLLDEYRPDYIVDAIDTLTPKAQLIREALHRKIEIVSSMGSGAKFDPSRISVCDISKTIKCPLAQRLRAKLREWKITKGVQAVFSDEDFDRSKFIKTEGLDNKKTTVGTISYMPAIFGCYCASVVVRSIMNKGCS